MDGETLYQKLSEEISKGLEISEDLDNELADFCSKLDEYNKAKRLRAKNVQRRREMDRVRKAFQELRSVLWGFPGIHGNRPLQCCFQNKLKGMEKELNETLEYCCENSDENDI